MTFITVILLLSSPFYLLLICFFRKKTRFVNFLEVAERFFLFKDSSYTNNSTLFYNFRSLQQNSFNETNGLYSKHFCNVCCAYCISQW